MAEAGARTLEFGSLDPLGLTTVAGLFESTLVLWPLWWGGGLSVARWRMEDRQRRRENQVAGRPPCWTPCGQSLLQLWIAHPALPGLFAKTFTKTSFHLLKEGKRSYQGLIILLPGLCCS